MYNLIMNSTAGYLLQIIPFILLTGIVYIIARRVHLKRRRKSWNRLGREAVQFLFVCYLAGLFALVWVPANLWSNIWFFVLNGYSSGGGVGPMFVKEFNFMPSILRYLSGELTGGSWVKFMAVGNVLMFLPFGFLLPFLWKKAAWWKLLLLGLSVSIVVELGQPVVGRSCDIDDIIANTVGAVIGYLVFALVRLALPNTVQRIRRG